jgi:hypothetical protein
MIFTGPELSDVLGRSGNEIELRNQYGRCCRVLSRNEALALDPEILVGVGNIRRIRFLRPRESNTFLNAGSHTTQRMKSQFGASNPPPWVREHRGTPGTRK